MVHLVSVSLKQQYPEGCSEHQQGKALPHERSVLLRMIHQSWALPYKRASSIIERSSALSKGMLGVLIFEDADWQGA